MNKYATVLSIAGSDCSGGAGIQADLKTISALGGYAATAITAITVQNTCGVRAIHPVPPEFVKGQIEVVMEDIYPDAIKIGMINEVDIVKVIADSIRKYQPKWVVFDPVMVSTSGCKLIEDEAIESIKTELIPLSDVITPNLKEAEVLLDRKIETFEEMKEAAVALLRFGSKAVLLKGGHLHGNNMTDILQFSEKESPVLYHGVKTESRNTHGTGCTLSSAIATLLAQGYSMEQAVGDAKKYVADGIFYGKDVHIGEGHGPLNHFFAPIPMKIKSFPCEKI